MLEYTVVQYYNVGMNYKMVGMDPSGNHPKPQTIYLECPVAQYFSVGMNYKLVLASL